MLLQDVNPFVRCAVRFHFREPDSVRCPADTRILYVLDGTGTLSVSGSEYPLAPGTLVLIGAGFVYRLQLDSPLELIALNFDYTWARKDMDVTLAALPTEAAAGVEKDSFEDCSELSQPLVFHRFFHMREPLESIVSVFQTQRTYFREEASALLKTLLIRLANAAMLERTESNELASQLIRYLQEHYREDLKAEQVAAHFNYHASHINRILYRATGTTLHNYLIRYRLNVAKTLLLSTSLTVCQISDRIGFKNAGHFSNTFRKATGCSPSEYRATRQNYV